MYLILLQIRFYDQQDSVPSLEINNGECNMNNNDEKTGGVMKLATSYDSNHNPLSFNNKNNITPITYVDKDVDKSNASAFTTTYIYDLSYDLNVHTQYLLL